MICTKSIKNKTLLKRNESCLQATSYNSRMNLNQFIQSTKQIHHSAQNLKLPEIMTPRKPRIISPMTSNQMECYKKIQAQHYGMTVLRLAAKSYNYRLLQHDDNSEKTWNSSNRSYALHKQIHCDVKLKLLFWETLDFNS